MPIISILSNPHLYLSLLLLVCSLSIPVIGIAAQTDTAARWRLSLDNDAFAPSNNDRDYTGGISLIYSAPPSEAGPGKPPRISLDAIINVINLATGVNNNTARRTRYATEVGTAAFTPENIQSSEPQYDDRPYASLVYLSSTRQSLSTDSRQAITQTLTLGILGLSLDKYLQNILHRPLKGNLAQGWGHQISAGGEPTLRYSLSRQTRHWASKNPRGADFDISSTLKGNLGYLTDLGWGISGRMGRISGPGWGYNPLLEDYAERGNAHTTRSASGSQFYLWSGLFVRARIYNALLQGQFRDSAVSYSRDELNTLIADAWLGLEYVFAGGMRLSYSWHAQTAEVKQGKANRNLAWGSMSLSGSF